MSVVVAKSIFAWTSTSQSNAFHLLNFAHMQMIQRILLKFKPGASQSSAIGMIAAESEFRR